MTLPHGRYHFTCSITDPVLDGQMIIRDLECEVDLDIEIFAGVPMATCTEVYIEGRSLRQGGEVSRLIRSEVQVLAEADFRDAGPLWDAAQKAEGLAMIGRGPDAEWRHA